MIVGTPLEQHSLEPEGPAGPGGLNEWYRELDPSLPLLLTERVETALLKLLTSPGVGAAIADSDIRKWHPRGTPHLIFYRPLRDGIRILKVRHERSNWTSDRK